MSVYSAWITGDIPVPLAKNCRILLAAQKNNSYRLLWMLGLALTLPMILASGPLAGYLIGYLLIEHFGAPSYVIPVLIGLGLIGSGVQTYRLIKKLNQGR